MTGRALIVHRHMVRVGIVVTIRHAWDGTELLAVLLRELTAQTLCGCGKHRVVMMILLAEIVDALTHITDNLQSQFLTLSTLTMMLTRKGNETLCQSDETDAEGTLIDHALDGIIRFQLIGTDPEALHQQGELLGEGGLLELVTVIKLLSSHLEHMVELGEEQRHALILHLLGQLFTFHFQHTLDSKLHDVDGREREIATSDGSFRSEAVLKHTGTTTHRGHLMHIALRIVSPPVAVLVVGGIEVQEVGEEPAGRHLTGKLVEVKVTILRQVVHPPLLLPDLNGEDGSLAVAHTLVGGEQDLTHDATAFRTRVRTIIN